MSTIRLIWILVLWPGVSLTELNTLDPYNDRKFNGRTSYDDRELALTVHDVVPDVIECTPMYNLLVEFLGENVVDHGNIMDQRDCLSAPYVVEWPIEKGVFYTLALVGPDYPSRENRIENEEWNHWLIVNIHEDKWLNGEVIAKYIGPHLLKSLGFHRYIFLIYKQPLGRMTFNETHLDETIDQKTRGHFSIKAFSAKYAMGPPLAGNFFFTP